MIRVVITFVFALMVSVTSVIGSAAAKNWNTGSSNQTANKPAMDKHIKPKQEIQKTTSDWLEAERTNILLTDSDAVFQLALQYYDAWPSKWYQPDLNGDDNPDLVIFGIRKPSNAAKEWLDDFDMCGADECQDWAVAPFMMLAEKAGKGNIQFRRPREGELNDKRLIARTSGGKTIFADFNGDGLDDIYVPSWGLGANKGAIDSLLMSSSNGKYEDLAPITERMNVRSLRHWASAGDIDNDSDIDIVAGDLGANNGQAGAKIDCFLNDGKGNFSHSFCLKINTFSNGKYRSWGGTLFDLDADGDLDLWVSLEGKKPTVFLGDGSGKYSSSAKIEIDFPKIWPTKMRQIGYVMASDIEGDGFVDIFFSVQGKSNCGKTYCGSYVGYFKNDKGNLNFKNFIEKVEENESLIWGRTSMIVVKDVNGDGLKDVYLKRNYKNPIYYQDKNGLFTPAGSTAGIELKLPTKNTKLEDSFSGPDGSTPSGELCKKALNEDGTDWNSDYPKWVRNAKGRGFDISTCDYFRKQAQPTNSTKSKGANENTNTNTITVIPQTIAETPDGTTPSKELCKGALLPSGYDWNNKKPLWVKEAKRRGLDVGMCNKFASKYGS